MCELGEKGENTVLMRMSACVVESVSFCVETIMQKDLATWEKEEKSELEGDADTEVEES